MNVQPKTLKIFELIFCLSLLTVSAFGQDDVERTEADKKQSQAVNLFYKEDAASQEQAKKIFTENLTDWGKLKDSEKTIQTLFFLLKITTVKQPAEAITYAKQIFSLTDNFEPRQYRAESYFALCWNQMILNDPKNARPNCEAAAAIFNELGKIPDVELLVSGHNIFNFNSRKREAFSLRQLAAITNAEGDTEKATEIAVRSIQILEKENDFKNAFALLSGAGSWNYQVGNFRNAIELNDRAIEIGKKEKFDLNLILYNQGTCYQKISLYQKAIDYQKEGIAFARQSKNREIEAIIKTAMASSYNVLGETDTAFKLLEETLVIFKELKSLRWQSQVHIFNGELFAKIEKLEKALESYQSAYDAAKLAGSKDFLLISLISIGKVKTLLGKPEEAVETLKQAESLMDDKTDFRTRSYVVFELGKAYSLMKNDEKALENFKKSEAIDRSFEVPLDLVGTLYEYAAHENRFNRKQSALNKMKETIVIIEDLRNEFINEGYRTNFLSAYKKYYDFYLELLIDTQKQNQESNYGDIALKLSESIKARSLLDTLGQNISEIRGNLDPNLLEEEKTLRKTINKVETQKANAVQSQNKNLAIELEKEISQLFEKYRDLQAKLVKSNPQFGSLNAPKPLNLQDIQHTILDDETVLLEYYMGETRSFLFFATNKNLEIFELPSRKVVEEQIRLTLDNLKSRSQNNTSEPLEKRTERIRSADEILKADLQKVSEMLLAPVAGKIKNKRLAVVASGVLQYFPFSVLRTQSGNKYLIETNEIVYLPSASTVSLMRQSRKPKKFATQLAVLADPVFTQSDMRLANVVKPQQNTTDTLAASNSSATNILLRSDFARLRFSREEAQSISSFVSTNQKFVGLDFNASLKSIGDNRFRDSEILHFATHGVVNSQYPELSGIVLSLFDEKGNPQEGFLRLHDVFNLQLNADLVVLSACETALGKEIKGEGIVGLTRGFMYAGTPLVAASLWRVDDRATADLMKRFYQKMLVEKMKPSAALRQAQIAMIKEKSTNPPFYWAGFTLQGDWR